MDSSTADAPSVSGVELPAVIVASPSETPNTGFEGGELLRRRVRAQVLVAGQATVRRDEVVEEAAVVGRTHLLVAGRGQCVLVLALDAELLRGDRGVLAIDSPVRGSPLRGISMPSLVASASAALMRSGWTWRG